MENMIRIVEDSWDLSIGQTIEQVISLAGYPHQGKEILKALEPHQDYSSTVHQTMIILWLKKMDVRYRHGAFTLEIIDAHGTLARRWGKGILAPITNEDTPRTELLVISNIYELNPCERNPNGLLSICG